MRPAVLDMDLGVIKISIIIFSQVTSIKCELGFWLELKTDTVPNKYTLPL